MRKFTKLLAAALILVMAASFMCVSATAADYTFTVTLSAGGLDNAVIDPAVFGAYTTSWSGEKLIVSGIPYNTVLNLSGAVGTMDGSKYVVRGYVKAGRDYEEAILSMRVTGDTDIVTAYSLPGQQVAYTVNYIDSATGNALAKADTFYGTIGDKPVATFAYIDGFTPNALNLTKTLSANPEDNEFTFVYTKVPPPVVIIEWIVVPPAPEEEPADGQDTQPTPEPTMIPVETEVPAEVEQPRDLIDLDEEEVPLSDGNDPWSFLKDANSRKGAIIGGSIAAAALMIAGAASLIFKKKNKKT